MNKKQLRKNLIELAKSYNIKLFFSHNIECGGWAKLAEEEITCTTKRDKDETMSIVCHEICHILNKRDGKYPIYHNPRSWPKDRRYSTGFLSTAHRAEMYTEKRAKELMKKHYPRHRFVRSYFNRPSSKLWLKLQLSPMEDSE